MPCKLFEGNWVPLVPTEFNNLKTCRDSAPKPPGIEADDTNLLEALDYLKTLTASLSVLKV